MARLPRLCLPGIPQHIIQRGTNRQACFASEDDFAAYANWLNECARKNDVAIHAWVFMTNHVHLLATPGKTQGISMMMQTLCDNRGQTTVSMLTFTLINDHGGSSHAKTTTNYPSWSPPSSNTAW